MPVNPPKVKTTDPLFSEEEDKEVLKKEGWIWKRIGNFFKVQFQAVWEDYTNIWPNAIRKAIQSIGENWSSMLDDQWAGYLGYYRNIGMIDDDDINAIIKEKKVWGIFHPFYFLFVAFMLFTNWLKIKFSTLSGTYIQKINKEYSPNPPSPGDVMRALFIAPEKSDDIKDAMMRAGYSKKDIDLMILSNYATYPIEMIRVAWLRGILSDDKMYERMREIGFTDTRIKEIVQTWPIIPSPQDILWMVAKEAFEEDIIKHIGLDEEFPAGQTEWLEKQGVSEYWARKYWYAHWDTPSVGQAYEMLHRGAINEYEMDIAFRNAEVPPFWRQKLKEIAYNVYTRVDTRRMHQMGVLSDAELVKAYQDQGYNLERATKMAEFTKLYNAQSERDISMAQILKAYRERAISEQQAVLLLKELKYSADKAEWLIMLEDLKIEIEYQDILVKNIEDRYVNRLIDRQKAMSALNQINLPAREINLLLDRWEINLYKDKKLHSKTDLSKMFMSGIIDENEYKSDMERLGYDFRQTQNYLDYMKKTKKQI
jgi:hypothetical protein